MAIIGGEATPAELLDALRTLSPSRLELISSPGARLQIATDRVDVLIHHVGAVGSCTSEAVRMPWGSAPPYQTGPAAMAPALIAINGTTRTAAMAPALIAINGTTRTAAMALASHAMANQHG